MAASRPEDPTWADVRSLYDRVHQAQRRGIHAPPALRAGFDEHRGSLETSKGDENDPKPWGFDLQTWKIAQIGSERRR